MRWEVWKKMSIDLYKLALTASFGWLLCRTIETHVRECRWAIEAVVAAAVAAVAAAATDDNATAASDTLAVMCRQAKQRILKLTNEFDNATLK